MHYQNERLSFTNYHQVATKTDINISLCLLALTTTIMIIIRRANEMESQPPYLDVQIQTKNALIEMPRTLKKTVL